MEMINGLGSSKGQLMTIAVLVFVLLMVSALLVLVIVGIGYDSVSESTIISSSSASYGTALQRSADSFAYGSGSAALHALFVYEYNPSMRGTNLISNFSEFMQYLIVNGTVPNVNVGSASANAVLALMANSTFASYNSVVSSATGAGSKQITVTESKPQVFQTGPYSISVQYTEYANINTSSGSFSYAIPVNVSIPINNTPDLFYAQQGVLRPVKFAGPQPPVSVIGGYYASSGNTSSFVYGTVYSIPSPGSCPSSPASLLSSYSPQLSAAPYNSQVILVTPNAVAITSGGCTDADAYGGLITQQVGPNPPAVPYLNFSATQNALQYLQTGQQVLLYGPSLAVLNITGLITDINSGDYFTSPFAPSFSQRASGYMNVQSPGGIFTFAPYGRLAAVFNNTKGSEMLSSETQSGVVGYTVAEWVYPTSQSSAILEEDRGASASTSGNSLTLGFGVYCGGEPGQFFFGDNSNNVGIGVQSQTSFPNDRWYFVVGTFNGVTGGAVRPGQFRLYVNGALISNSSWCGAGSDTAPLTGLGPISIGGYEGSYAFNGSISNVQIYNSTLTAAQVMYLYQEGIEGIPIANSMLLGWYPLNGNPNDYSGNGYGVYTNQLSYALPSGYTRDSILPGNLSQYSYPVPGVENCNTVSQCINYTLPHLYLGDMPLSIGSQGLSAAYFNGQSSCIGIPSAAPFANQPGWTYSAWIYPQTTNSFMSQNMIYSEGVANSIMYIEITPSNGLAVATWNTGYSGYWQPLLADSSIITPNAWNYVTVTLSGGGVYPTGTGKIYVNGVAAYSGNLGEEYAQSAYPSWDHYTALGNNIGSYQCKAGSINSGQQQDPYEGLMANVQLYNYTLSASQVSQLYQEGINAPPLYPANLVAWYPLDGNSNDYSGRQNYGMPNSTSYQYIASSYTSANSAAASIGYQTTGSVNGEWQALGFGAKSVPQFLWNVTAWTVCPTPSSCSTQEWGGSPSITYNDILANPVTPYISYGGNNIESAALASGVEGGPQGWYFGTDYYDYVLPQSNGGYNFDFLGTPSQLFPTTLSKLDANTLCSNPYNSTGYTATTTQWLSGTYSIAAAADDLLEFYYRPVWAPFNAPTMLPAGKPAWWGSSPATQAGEGPVNVSFAPGYYNLEVDWANLCAAGVSDFSMSPEQSVVWNVKSYTESSSTNPANEPYATAFPTASYALSPQGFSQSASGIWYGGAVGGIQKWNYGTYAYEASPSFYSYMFNGLAPTPFPQPFGSFSGTTGTGLNSNTFYSGTFTFHMYTANAIMYLTSATQTINLAIDDQMAVFYEPVGGSWTAVTSCNYPYTRGPAPSLWPDVGQTAGSYLYSCTFTPSSSGMYNIAVDWNNLNGDGLSAFWMN